MAAFLASVPPRPRELPRLSRKDFPSPRFSLLFGFWTLPSGRYQVDATKFTVPKAPSLCGFHL
eukprot:4412239-Pyramimonas_sp.AAC.1